MLGGSSPNPLQKRRSSLPKITFCYNPGTSFVSVGAIFDVGWTERLVKQLAEAVRPLAAELCSTEEGPLTVDDIDFVAFPYPAGSVAGVSLEIETFAYPARIAKLTKERLLAFKADLMRIADSFDGILDVDRKHLGFYGENLFVWLKLVDPRGYHV